MIVSLEALFKNSKLKIDKHPTMWQYIIINQLKYSAIWSIFLIVDKSKFEFLHSASRFYLHFLLY